MDQDYKTGECLIDFTCIYKITEISYNSTNDRLIHYQPIKGTDKVFTDTIPEKNLSKAGLRRLLTNQEIDLIFDDLKSSQGDYIFDPRQIKEDIYSNIPLKLLTHLKYLYQNITPLLKADQGLKDEILNHLCLEISFVKNQTTSSIKTMLETILLNKFKQINLKPES